MVIFILKIRSESNGGLKRPPPPSAWTSASTPGKLHAERDTAMKNRICAALLTLVLCLPLAGCAGGASSGISVSYPAEPSSGADSGMQAGKAYTVGILQQMEHTSLDEIREAVEAGLARGAAAGGYTVEVVYKNAQGDPTAIRTIAEQFAAQGVDVIVPIATGAAQGAAAAAQDVPIVFSAVADPVAAGLVDAFDRTTGNITGVSNGIDVAKIFALADELTPGIGTYGFVYNEGEVNSQSIIEKAKAFLDARGLAYEEVTVASSGEVQQAARGVVAKGVDALFIPNDNTVASALPVLAQEAIAAGLPVYPTADSMVRDGGLATVGINYTVLGGQTADMVCRVLEGTPIADIPVELLNESSVVVNGDTAAALGVDVSRYVQ